VIVIVDHSKYDRSWSDALSSLQYAPRSAKCPEDRETSVLSRVSQDSASTIVAKHSATLQPFQLKRLN